MKLNLDYIVKLLVCTALELREPSICLIG